MKIFDNKNSYTLNLIISQLVYIAFFARARTMKTVEAYVHFIKKIEEKELDIKENKITEIFMSYLTTHYARGEPLMEKMFQNNYADPNHILKGENYYLSVQI